MLIFGGQMDSYHSKVSWYRYCYLQVTLSESASATAAASAGITTNQIMEAADWRSESVFERFYYKPFDSNLVGQAVLSTPTTDSLQTSC